MFSKNAVGPIHELRTYPLPPVFRLNHQLIEITSNTHDVRLAERHDLSALLGDHHRGFTASNIFGTFPYLVPNRNRGVATLEMRRCIIVMPRQFEIERLKQGHLSSIMLMRFSKQKNYSRNHS